MKLTILTSIFFHSTLIFAEGLVAYSIPKGVQRGIEIDLSDQSYDGQDEGDRLVGGLGQLTDGTRGNDNFRSDVNGFGKGNIYDSWKITPMQHTNIGLANQMMACSCTRNFPSEPKQDEQKKKVVVVMLDKAIMF